MKAMVLREVKRPLDWQERPNLEPAAGRAIVKLEAAALNRRDFWITQGMYPGIKTPVILGSDGAGAVQRAGQGVEPSWLGQRVVINPAWDWGNDPSAQAGGFRILGMPDDGTFATELSVPAEYLHAKPEHLSWHEAAALPLGGMTAYRAVFTQGGLCAGEKVLVTGIGGGVATFALQYCVFSKAEVFVTSSSAEKIERAIALGARAGYDYRSEGWSKQLMAEHGAMDLIIDSAGGQGYRDLIELAAAGGRIVNYGCTAGAPPKFDLFKLFWKQLHVIGSTMGSPDDFTAMLDFVRRHQVRPIVDQVLPLTEANQALERMATSPQFGKLVLDCDV